MDQHEFKLPKQENVIVMSARASDFTHYLRNYFDTEPPWGTSSINFHLNDLLERGERIR